MVAKHNENIHSQHMVVFIVVKQHHIPATLTVCLLKTAPSIGFMPWGAFKHYVGSTWEKYSRHAQFYNAALEQSRRHQFSSYDDESRFHTIRPCTCTDWSPCIILWLLALMLTVTMMTKYAKHCRNPDNTCRGQRWPRDFTAHLSNDQLTRVDLFYLGL
jgi:hypothetical protein